MKKPIYKKWWFWVVVVLVIGIFGSNGDGEPVVNDVAAESPASPAEASAIEPEDATEPDISEDTQQPDTPPAVPASSAAQPTTAEAPTTETPAIEVAPAENDAKELYTVTKVTDGDTIEIDYNGATEKVRLIGVDTPESVHPDAAKNSEFGKIASDFTKDNLLDKQVGLEFDVSERDRYGRMLAYVWLGEIMYNEYLVEQGYAKVATYPPDVKYVDRFTAAQEKARNASLGLWGYSEDDAQATAEPPAEPAAQVTTPVPTTIGTATVYITDTGEKYHRSSCRHLSESKIEISLESAKSQGYTPCGTCKPQQ